MMTATKIDEKISKTRKLLCLLFKTVLSDFKTIGMLITLTSKNSLKILEQQNKGYGFFWVFLFLNVDSP